MAFITDVNITLTFLLIVGTALSVQYNANDFMTPQQALGKVNTDFNKLHKGAGEVQLKNMYNMLRMYTLFSQEQAHQVVEYIEQHSNLTSAENLSLRMANNGAPSINDCIIRGELSLIQAYRNTWYNVQNCIRSAQLSYEKQYESLNKKLDLFKNKVLASLREFQNLLRKCANGDHKCLVPTVVQSIIRYESLNAELEDEVIEGNNLNSRYIVKGVAMGCVSSSFEQVHSNYVIGKNISANCFTSQQNSTNVGH